MKTSMLRTGLPVWIAFLLLPTTGRAEIVTEESIEWVLANSDRVVVGKVIKADRVAGPDNQNYPYVTIAISKSLKGRPTDQVTVLLHPLIAGGYPKQWLEEGIPLLFCLSKNDGKLIPFSPEKIEWILRDNGNEFDAVLMGKSRHEDTGCISVFTRGFAVLTASDAILKYVEQTVKEGRKAEKLQSHVVDVPSGTPVYNKLHSEGAVELIVPIDENLEGLGHRWCKSASAYERKEGTQILAHFKSEKNIALLKSLLGDPSTATSCFYRSEAGKKELELVYRKKWYYVRQAAFEALLELGVEVDRPELEKVLEGPENGGGLKPDDRKPER